MLGILDQRHANILAFKQIHQLYRMIPWHVGIAHALQDAHRAASIHTAADQMLAPRLDQPARETEQDSIRDLIKP